MDLVAEIMAHRLRFLQNPVLPEYYFCPKRQIGLEVHMDDGHGFGERGLCETFLKELGRHVPLKHFHIHDHNHDSRYSHFKR